MIDNLHLLQSPLRRPCGSIVSIGSSRSSRTPRCDGCENVNRQLTVIKEQIEEKDKTISALKRRLATAQAIADLS